MSMDYFSSIKQVLARDERSSRAIVGGLLATAALVAAALVAPPAQAHGGGLDWQGGHNCRVGSCAGTYHCHQARGGICARDAPAPSVPAPSLWMVCSQAQGEAEDCESGRDWNYESCWRWDSNRGQVNLDKKRGSLWKRQKSNVARWDIRSCDSEYPWLTAFTVRDMAQGTHQFRLGFPDKTFEYISVRVLRY